MTDENYHEGLEALWSPGRSKPSPKKRRSTPRKDLESAVQRECLLWLRAQPDTVLVERRSTGAVQFEGGGMLRFGVRGRADIWCVVSSYEGCLPDGKTIPVHVEIECKRRDGKGRLSHHQQAFKDRCDKHGIPYFVVTSADDLKKQWKAQFGS